MIEGGRPEDAAVVVDYSLTTGDTFAAGLAASRYSVMANGLGAALAGSGLFSILANGDWTGLIPATIGLLFMSGVVFAGISALAMSRRKDLLQMSYRLIVDPERIRTESPMMNGDASWASYKRVRPTRSTLLLELGTGVAVMIPLRALAPDELARVLGWAEAAGVLDRSSSLRPTLLGIALGMAFNVIVFVAAVFSFNVQGG
jgi:hypothetical protein